MNVLNTIIDSIPFFVNNILKEKGDESLEYVFSVYIKNCINISFDSKFFYLTRFDDEIGFEITNAMDISFLKMLKELIQTRSMNENIKNSSNRIHFRVFKNNVLLDSKENEIRIEIVKNLAKHIGKDVILKFFIENRIALMNKTMTLDRDSDEWCENEVLIYRTLIIIESILEHKDQLSQT